MHAVFLLALVFFIFYFMFHQDNLVFRLTIKDGKIVKIQGDAPLSWLDEIERNIQKVRCGHILGYREGGRVRLKFNGDIQDSIAQKLRNIFGVSQS